MKALSRLDREAVKIVYFRADTADDIDGMEVSWDDGITWTPLTAATDGDNQPAYSMTVRGPDAESVAGRKLNLGRNRGVTRVADNPEIEILRWTIDVV